MYLDTRYKDWSIHPDVLVASAPGDVTVLQDLVTVKYGRSVDPPRERTRLAESHKKN